jgi:hypothetical protein
LCLFVADEPIAQPSNAGWAPHGYVMVPSYNDDGIDEPSIGSGWKLEPRRMPGCRCKFCQERELEWPEGT